MLSQADNELLTRTGSGTPMGELMRRYWVPALLSREIPAPDCPPVQVRILGEELVAFRDSAGRIGLLDEHCSHRGTSLFYGRNEACGLTCVYHGWKYDVEGHVLDTPAEPAGSTFKDRLRHPAYLTHETGGIIWAYLGPHDDVPLFPDLEWANVPVEQTYVTKAYQECNYLQGLEGECDSAHLTFLHRYMNPTGAFSLFNAAAPSYEVEDTDFGVRLIATRPAGAGKSYVRVSAYLLPAGVAVPVGSLTGAGTEEGYEVHFYTPLDDTHSWRFDFGFRRARAVREDEIFRRNDMDTTFMKRENAANRYRIDRDKQRTFNYTGIESFLAHDSMATESMGPLFDRSREHLGVSDMGVIAVRRRMLEVVKAFQGGAPPPFRPRRRAENDYRHADSIAQIIEGNDWRRAFPHLVNAVGELPAADAVGAPR